MLGVTTKGPALSVHAYSAANEALRSGISIFPMHKGIREPARVAGKAATIKVHMRAYLNFHLDIDNADQMFDAMTSSGGIPSLSVTLCDSVKAAQAGPYKIDGVSFPSKIAYTTEGIRV